MNGIRCFLTILSLSAAIHFFSGMESRACTAAVISGKATSDGRPLLWKHRDTDNLDNRLEYFVGEKYSFTGLVNSNGNSAPVIADGEREVWIGANTAGFSIMNTASYNLNYDDVPESCMDREGILIFKALGICKNLSDFESFLDTLGRPLGVEASFGVVDAEGGAAVYEVGNYSYVKYDANDPSVAPRGYIVFTNFSFSGKPEDRLGYERYLTASAIFEESWEEGRKFSPDFIFNCLSRSYRNDFMGIDYCNDYIRMSEEGLCNGIVPDSDFIPRRSTSASVIVQGTVPEGDPLQTVMWTLLGYPVCGTAIPVPVSEKDIIPDYMKSSEESSNSRICDISLKLKYRHVFRFDISSGRKYLDISRIFGGKGRGNSLLSCSISSDMKIRDIFMQAYGKYLSGNIGKDEFLRMYCHMSPDFLKIYLEEFEYFIY